MILYTIGHGNHSLDKFIQLLEDNGVMTLVDVRSAPYSRYNPQFNKENLQYMLPERWMEYVYAGKYLCGRPPDPSLYKNKLLPQGEIDYLHEVDYAEIMKRDWFQKAILQLLELADQQTTAILCSEEDPSACHRHHLIAKYLMAQYPEVEVRHIRGDGQVYGAGSIHKSVDEQPGEQLSLF